MFIGRDGLSQMRWMAQVSRLMLEGRIRQRQVQIWVAATSRGVDAVQASAGFSVDAVQASAGLKEIIASHMLQRESKRRHPWASPLDYTSGLPLHLYASRTTQDEPDTRRGLHIIALEVCHFGGMLPGDGAIFATLPLVLRFREAFAR